MVKSFEDDVQTFTAAMLDRYCITVMWYKYRVRAYRLKDTKKRIGIQPQVET